MFLHIGSNEIISINEIIGFFSIRKFLKSKENVILYKKLLNEKKIIKNTDKKSKTIIFLTNGKCIESCISVSTLSKRLNLEEIINKLPKWSGI